jgi:predicted Abi (CAAX) family protease
MLLVLWSPLDGLKLIPQGVGKGRHPQHGPRIELLNPGAVHIFEEGGNLWAIVLLPHLAAFSHLQYGNNYALEKS